MPAARHRSRSPRRAFAVRATIGTRRPSPSRRRISRVASKPSTSGIQVDVAAESLVDSHARGRGHGKSQQHREPHRARHFRVSRSRPFMTRPSPAGYGKPDPVRAGYGPVRAGGVPADEEPGAARGPDHPQCLDLGALPARAASGRGGGGNPLLITDVITAASGPERSSKRLSARRICSDSPPRPSRRAQGVAASSTSGRSHADTAARRGPRRTRPLRPVRAGLPRLSGKTTRHPPAWQRKVSESA